MFRLFKKIVSSTKNKDGNKSPKYYNLKIRKIIQETNEAISIEFDPPPSGNIPYKAGQFLTIIQIINGQEIRRSYSLCSSPIVDTYMAVTVKRVEKGVMSNWLADQLRVGQIIKVLGPMGQFTLEFDNDQQRHLILFAGGSGITPMLSIIKTVLASEPKSIVSLIYCNRHEDSIIFKSILEKIELVHHGKLHVTHILDEAPTNWQGLSGLLNGPMLSQLFEKIPNWEIEKSSYLLCGPEGMMKNVEALLFDLHIPKEQIQKESFANSPSDKLHTKVLPIHSQKDYEVTIHYNGQEYKVLVPSNKSILSSALDQGVDLPFSCQSGLCTACRGKTLSGKVKLDEEDSLSQSERAAGYVLTCVGHPLSDDVVIEIG